MHAGMKCGGCVGHVKQLLEQHASVSAATVNLATETALVRVKLQPGTDITTLAAELAKVSVCFDTWVCAGSGGCWRMWKRGGDSRQEGKKGQCQRKVQCTSLWAWGLQTSVL